MSLINDALRKAQKQRTGEAPPLASMPAIGGESAVRIAKRSKPAGFNSLLLRSGLGAAALAIIVIGGVVLMQKKPSVQPSVPTAEASAPKPAEVAAKPTTAAPPPIQATPTTTFVVAATPPKTESPALKAEEPKPIAAIGPVVVTPASQPIKPVAPPNKLEPRAINYIESLRVAGIRASTTDSKVLMNDRVYRIGSIVEHEMGLKLTGITATSLTFEDERGGSYTRTFN